MVKCIPQENARTRSLTQNSGLPWALSHVLRVYLFNPLPFLITYSVIRVVRAFSKPPYAAAARSHALYRL